MHKAVQICEDSVVFRENPLYCSGRSVAHWLKSLSDERDTLATVEATIDENTDPLDGIGAKKPTKGESCVKKRRILGQLQTDGMDLSGERKRRQSPRKQPARPSTRSGDTAPAEQLAQSHGRSLTPDNLGQSYLDGVDDEATPRSNQAQALGLSTFTALAQPVDLAVNRRQEDVFSSRTRSSTSKTTSSHESGSKKSRSRSPLKRMRDFQLSNVHVDLRDFDSPGYPTPQGADGLLRDLADISAGEGVVPRRIAKLAGSDHNIRRYNIADDDGDNRVSGAMEEPALADAELLMKVSEIQEAARECRSEDLSEASWNAEVHSRVLRLALSGRAKSMGVWYRDITTARIYDKSLIPQVADTAMPSKMVDYALIISGQADASFQERIIHTLKTSRSLSINHTAADYARFSPIAVSIETKRAAIDEDAANVQLGLWVSAHFARLRQLTSGTTWLPALPLVIVQGHQWKLMIAESISVRQVRILRDRAMGDTSSLVGIFKLIASLRRLGLWAATDYKKFLEEEVLLQLP